jgi:hypothetical protein
MKAAEHRVAIVVDPQYGEQVIELARDRHVWLVRSPRNDEAAAALWQDASEHTLQDCITTFNGADSPESAFIAILGTVELHHGEYSHDPPLSVIETIGLRPTSAVSDALSEYGFQEVEATPDGFIARREPSS